MQIDRHREAMKKQIKICNFHCNKNADICYKKYICIRIDSKTAKKRHLSFEGNSNDVCKDNT